MEAEEDRRDKGLGRELGGRGVGGEGRERSWRGGEGRRNMKTDGFKYFKSMKQFKHPPAKSFKNLYYGF